MDSGVPTGAKNERRLGRPFGRYYWMAAAREIALVSGERSQQHVTNASIVILSLWIWIGKLSRKIAFRNGTRVDTQQYTYTEKPTVKRQMRTFYGKQKKTL